MPLNTKLHTSLRYLDISRPVSSAVCQHRLASRAAAWELADGVIVNPVRQEMTWFLPLQAARPVAPYTAGLRFAGYRSYAAWGASSAIGFFRVDLPILALFYFWHIQGILGRLKPVGRTERHEQEQRTLWQNLQWASGAAVTLAFALCGWEIFFGTRQTAARHHAELPLLFEGFDYARRKGLIGYLQDRLESATDAAIQAQDSARERRLLVTRIAITALVQIPLLASAVVVGTIGVAGASLGLSYGAICHLRMASARVQARLAGRELAQTRLADLREQAAALAALGDEQLPAAVLDAVEREDQARLARQDNGWVGLAAAGSGLLRMHRRTPWGLWPTEIERQARMAELGRGERVLRHLFGAQAQQREPADFGGFEQRPAPQPQPQPAPQRQDDPNWRAGQNVHGRGRDALTRQSIARLAERFPQISVTTELEDLRRFIRLALQNQQRYVSKQHPSGLTQGEAAQMALDGGQGWTLFRHVTDANNTLMMDWDETVAMSLVTARIWHAIGHLRDEPSTPERDQHHRQERKEAFVTALADCLSANRDHYCAPGQSQRLMMVLNQQLPEVVIEAYEEKVAVAQFVTAKSYALQRELGDDPQDDRVREAFDQAYVEGARIYRGDERNQLREQLIAIADLNYDVAWRPRV